VIELPRIFSDFIFLGWDQAPHWEKKRKKFGVGESKNPTWSRHPNDDYRYFFFGLKMTIIVTLGHRQMTRVKFLSKVNRKGKARYLLIWSIFFPKERFSKWLANKGLWRVRSWAHDNQVRENHKDGAEEGKEKKNDFNINGANSNPFPYERSLISFCRVRVGLG